MGPCSLWSAAASWCVLWRQVASRQCVWNTQICDFLPFLKVHYCTCVLPLPLLRMRRFISNFLLPSSSPSIVIQIPMLNYCACYCFQNHFSDLSQGGPRRLFFSKKPFSNAHLWYLLLLSAWAGGTLPSSFSHSHRDQTWCQKIGRKHR